MSVFIAISACLLYPDPNRAAFAKKTLQYMEQSVPHWLQGGGALPVLVPHPPSTTNAAAVYDRYAAWLDGLVLHGGVDMSPTSYGETALDPRWQGDALRDAYEMELARAFVRAGKPVFAICRGLQVLNVCFGGTLYQDINTQVPGSLTHRDAERYDQNFHTLQLVPNTRLAQLLAGQDGAKINSVHHQAIKQLARAFTVEARCPDDGVIEAIRYQGQAWVAGVQWHPEFHRTEDATLDDAPILQDFLQACLQARREA